MGNFCCTEDLNKGVKLEEFYCDVDGITSSPVKNSCYFQPHLETVKEEANENSELSEHRSISRASRRNN